MGLNANCRCRAGDLKHTTLQEIIVKVGGCLFTYLFIDKWNRSEFILWVLFFFVVVFIGLLPLLMFLTRAAVKHIIPVNAFFFSYSGKGCILGSPNRRKST